MTENIFRRDEIPSGGLVIMTAKRPVIEERAVLEPVFGQDVVYGRLHHEGHRKFIEWDVDGARLINGGDPRVRPLFERLDTSIGRAERIAAAIASLLRGVHPSQREVLLTHDSLELVGPVLGVEPPPPGEKRRVEILRLQRAQDVLTKAVETLMKALEQPRVVDEGGVARLVRWGVYVSEWRTAPPHPTLSWDVIEKDTERSELLFTWTDHPSYDEFVVFCRPQGKESWAEAARAEGGVTEARVPISPGPHRAQYAVIAYTPFDELQSDLVDVAVGVEEPPPAPPQEEVSPPVVTAAQRGLGNADEGNGDILVSWMTAETSGGEERWAEVQHRAAGATGWTGLEDDAPAEGELLFAGSDAGVAHDFRVRLASANGCSDWVTARFSPASDPAGLPTPRPTVRPVPGNRKSAGEGLAVHWNLPGESEPDSALLAIVERRGVGDEDEWESFEPVNAAERSFLDEDVPAGRAWTYRVRFQTAEAESEWGLCSWKPSLLAAVGVRTAWPWIALGVLGLALLGWWVAGMFGGAERPYVVEAPDIAQFFGGEILRRTPQEGFVSGPQVGRTIEFTEEVDVRFADRIQNAYRVARARDPRSPGRYVDGRVPGPDAPPVLVWPGGDPEESAAVAVALVWDNLNDLDLLVRAPSGADVFFQNPISACGGRLNIDANFRTQTDEPVERVVWKRNAPPGEYEVYVGHYRNHGEEGCEDPTPYQVRVIIEEDGSRYYSGEVSWGDPFQFVCRFQVGDGAEEPDQKATLWPPSEIAGPGPDESGGGRSGVLPPNSDGAGSGADQGVSRSEAGDPQPAGDPRDTDGPSEEEGSDDGSTDSPDPPLAVPDEDLAEMADETATVVVPRAPDPKRVALAPGEGGPSQLRFLDPQSGPSFFRTLTPNANAEVVNRMVMGVSIFIGPGLMDAERLEAFKDQVRETGLSRLGTVGLRPSGDQYAGPSGAGKGGLWLDLEIEPSTLERRSFSLSALPNGPNVLIQAGCGDDRRFYCRVEGAEAHWWVALRPTTDENGQPGWWSDRSWEILQLGRIPELPDTPVEAFDAFHIGHDEGMFRVVLRPCGQPSAGQILLRGPDGVLAQSARLMLERTR